MDISPVLFYVFASVALACALMVVLRSNPVTCAFNLVLVFFSFAAIYAMLGAHLLAALQIMVYAGAVMVLFIFVIMLLRADAPSLDMGRTSKGVKIFATACGATLLAFLVWMFRNSYLQTARGPFSPEILREAGGNTQVISELMFSKYILPFELTSILLLAAIVAVVAIAMRKGKGA